jgi:hypothetical protein
MSRLKNKQRLSQQRAVFVRHSRQDNNITMEKIILTPRLKLTLLESLEEASQDLEWVRAVRSDEQATQWR